jgi:transposase
MLRPMPIAPVPPETARVARAAFSKGNRYLRVADELDSLFTDEAFLALFPTHGQPALPPWRLALVTLLQFAEGLSDRQAADAVRSRIDWKYVLRLELTDPGFDASVLSEFRGRLIAGAAESLLFETLLTWCRNRQLVKARGRQRTDSTHVLAAVRALNRIKVVGETLRHALNTLAVVAPEWLREVPAVAILRRVWIQNYLWDGTQLQWREADNIPPAARFISSPDDSEAHYARQHTTHWVGDKVHITETCEDDLPHLITHIDTTPGPTADGVATPQIHAALEQRGLLPGTHIVDTGFLDADLLVDSRHDYGVDLLGPTRLDYHWQAREGAGLNVLRLGEWFLETSRAKTRITLFARLMAEGAAA